MVSGMCLVFVKTRQEASGNPSGDSYVYGDCKPSKTMVYKWDERFDRGRDPVHDEPHTGRPSTPSTPTNIDCVPEALNEDRRRPFAS